MLDLMVDFGIGQVLGVIAAWYLVTGQIVFVPWLVIIIGWKLGDMLLPNSALPLNSPFMPFNPGMQPVTVSPWQNLQFKS